MSGETKLIGGIAILTAVIFAGGIFFLSRESGSTITEDQVVTRNGLHWHPKLTIYIKDKKQEIPSNIGIGAIHQPIHTHEDAKDGVLHMEMKGVVTKENTKLGNFFRTWGKKFSSDGGVKMFVNGEENKNFENYEMHDRDIIEIRYK